MNNHLEDVIDSTFYDTLQEFGRTIVVVYGDTA